MLLQPKPDVSTDIWKGLLTSQFYLLNIADAGSMDTANETSGVWGWEPLSLSPLQY